MRKQTLSILLILIMTLTACGGTGNPSDDTGQTPTPTDSADAGKSDSTTASDSEKTVTLTLYADFSNGSSNGTVQTKQITIPAEDEPASQSAIAFALANGLSEWTGLNFEIEDVSFPDDKSIIADWSKDSTLIAGAGNSEFKEGFNFSNAVSLNWFIMDSLATTFKKNMEISAVYYQSDGQPVTFTNPEEMAAQGLPNLPVDQSYEGSAFFCAHDEPQDE